MRAILAVGLTVLAYHYSWISLGRGITAQTPLAYLALVPIIALALAWVRMSTGPALRPIHDRQVDAIVGTAVLLLAGAILILLPQGLDARFWLYRIDLLTLPLFVAGIVSLLYGVRWVWALRIPILFLLMAWPALYLPVIGEGMRASVDLSVSALVATAQFLPFARPISGGADGLFWINHQGEAFVLGVASACSGINSLIGFTLIGTALTSIVRGPMIRRIAWLLAGLSAIWLLNVTRIQLIFVVGALFGRDAAMEILHPVAGLLIFNLGLVVMLLLIPRFGLRFVRKQEPVAHPRAAFNGSGRLGVAAISAALAATVSFGYVNASYARYESLADASGQARLEPFRVDESLLSGWTVHHVARYEHGAPFFGEASTWERVRYSSDDAATLRATDSVYVDVIHTDDPNALIAYGLEECYTFHNYSIESRGSAELSPGVTAELLSYTNPRYDSLSTALKWELPFRNDDGSTWYQRVVLILPRGHYATLEGPIATDFTSSSAHLRQPEGFLVALARQLVQRQIALGRAT